MKTTIEIPDSLLREMRKIAALEGVTLQVLVERGLRRVVADVKHAVPFKLRQASYNGRGLRAELRKAPWNRLRSLTYEGRGG